MKQLFILLFVGLIVRTNAQNIERKIIIKNDQFYYTTIDKEFQIATLNTGKISETMETSKHLALPAGRNYNEPINPFCWDLSDSIVYAINFLNHPLNDRNESLKRFNLYSLHEWDSTISVVDMIMKSVDQNMFTRNDPYLFTIRRSNTLNNFFYDGIALNDSSYYMAIANNAELSIWNYNGKEWTHSEIQQFPVDGYFTLFTFSGHLYLLLSNGAIYEVSADHVLQEKKAPDPTLTDGLVIENRDDNTIKFIKKNRINQNTPLRELIEKKAVGIVLNKN
jgi:hypothetical protein